MRSHHTENLSFTPLPVATDSQPADSGLAVAALAMDLTVAQRRITELEQAIIRFADTDDDESDGADERWELAYDALIEMAEAMGWKPRPVEDGAEDDNFVRTISDAERIADLEAANAAALHTLRDVRADRDAALRECAELRARLGLHSNHTPYIATTTAVPASAYERVRAGGNLMLEDGPAWGSEQHAVRLNPEKCKAMARVFDQALADGKIVRMYEASHPAQTPPVVMTPLRDPDAPVVDLKMEGYGFVETFAECGRKTLTERQMRALMDAGVTMLLTGEGKLVVTPDHAWTTEQLRVAIEAGIELQVGKPAGGWTKDGSTNLTLMHGPQRYRIHPKYTNGGTGHLWTPKA